MRARVRSSTATRPGLAGCVAADGGAVEGREHVLGANRDPGLLQPLELVEDHARGFGGAEVALGSGADRRRAEAVGVSRHREHDRPGGSERRVLVGEQLEHRQRAARAQLRRLLDRAVSTDDRPPAQPAFEEVDVAAAEPGVRRPQEGEELATRAVAPGEAEQREQRLAERRRRQARPRLDRDGNAERAECRLDRRARALERRADDRDLLRGDAVADELEHGLGDELERGATAGSLEEAHRAVERRRRGGVVEEVALEMSETRRQVGVGARSELDDVAARERAEVGDRPRERGERRPARLVRQRDVHLTARRERLDQAPLRSRQVLEAVREDRGAVPRPELARQALDGPPANHAAIADGKALELGPVGARQLGQARARDPRDRAGWPRSR